MKILLCLLALALPLGAATQTGNITVPDPLVPDLKTIVEKWIQGQTNDDGTLKYPGLDEDIRRQALLDTLLRDGVRRVVVQACLQFLTDCPQDIKDKINAKATADADITAEVENIVQ